MNRLTIPAIAIMSVLGIGSALANYGAIATAIDGNHAASGVAYAPTQSQANQLAIQACIDHGGQSCAVVTTFSGGGCGFVTTGAEGGRVAWGAGPTSDRALNNCQSNGVPCQTPVGYCTAP